MSYVHFTHSQISVFGSALRQEMVTASPKMTHAFPHASITICKCGSTLKTSGSRIIRNARKRIAINGNLMWINEKKLSDNQCIQMFFSPYTPLSVINNSDNL
jgi:hypothetical protein